MKATPVQRARCEFAIVGAQKSGTTAFSRFLGQHPKLHTPSKETHFFDSDKMDWKSPDYGELEEKLAGAGPDQIAGIRTPIYMFWENSIERMKAYNPDMLLICLLRNPTERAYSNWQMMRAMGFEDLPFSEAIRGGRRRIDIKTCERDFNRRRYTYVERGFYAWQLERLIRLFRRDRLLILTHDQLIEDMRKRLDQACDFLGVPPYESYPENEVIYPGLKKAVRVLAPAPELTAEDAAYLDSLYLDDINACEKLAALDLSDWKTRL